MKSKGDEIPEIPSLKDEIITAINEKKLVIFIGAGVSRLTGCRGWSDLASDLVEKCFKEKIISYKEKESLKLYKDPKKIITISHHLLKKANQEEKFYKIMEDALIGKDVDKIYENLSNLSSLCVTTNADKMFHEYFANDRIISNNFNAADLSDNFLHKRLYQIHGRIDEREYLVFKVKEYLKRYNEKEFKEFLEKIFETYTVLFIGYGLEEFELLDYILTKADNNQKHYMLHPVYKDDINIFKFEMEYYNDLGVELLPYQKDENGYHQLVNVLSKWSEDVKYKTNKIELGYTEIEYAIKNSDISLLNQLHVNDSKKYLYKEIYKTDILSESVIEWFLNLDILKTNDIPKCTRENNIDNWKELNVYHHVISKNINSLKLNQIKKINITLAKLRNKILEKKIQNSRSNEIILKLIIMLKDKGLSPREKEFFSYILRNPEGQSLFGLYLEEDILHKLLNDKNISLLKYIIEECLDYKEDKRNITSIIRDYRLEKVYINNIEKIYEVMGENFLKILKNSIFKASLEEKDYYNNFIIPKLPPTESYYHYQKAMLSIFLKGIELLKSNEKKYKKFIMNLYKDKDIKIFKRMGIYLMGKNIDIFKKIILKDIEILLQNFEVENEVFSLLKENSEILLPIDLENIINAIDKISGSPYEKKYWLEAFKELNNEFVKKKYDEASENYPKKIKNPGESYVVRSGFYNPESPKSRDEIIYLVENNLDNLFKEFKEYENEKNFIIDEPSKDGLCKELKAAVIIKPHIFINFLEKLENIDKDYYYHIISGLITVLNNEKFLNNLDKVLLSLERKVCYENGKIFKEEKNTIWKLKYLIPDFLETSLRNLEDISNENLEKIFKIIKKSVYFLKDDNEKKDDAYSHLLNSLNGRYYYALVKLLEVSNNRKLNLKIEIVELFNEKLNKDINVDIAIASYLNFFMSVDSKWTTNLLDKLFDFSKNNFIWEALEGYLCINNIIYPNIYEELEEKYDILIEKYDKFKSEKGRKALVEHSLIAFYNFDGKEKQLYRLLNKNLEEVYLIVLSFLTYRKDLDKNKSKQLWDIISSKIEIINKKSQMAIMLFLSLINIEEITGESFNVLKKSISYIKEYPYNILEVFEYLLDKNVKNNKYIADILIEFCRNDIFFEEFEETTLRKILNKIPYKEKEIEIKNRYKEVNRDFKL